MRLLGAVRSPYVCKVRVIAVEKGVDCEFIDTGPRDPIVSGANPLSKVPTLIRDDGRPLYDSTVIAEYFDGLVEEPRLIPRDIEGRIEVKRWEALANGVIDALVEIMHDGREPEEKRKGREFVARQQKKIDAGLVRMEADVGERDYCYGDRLSLADIACGCALVYLDRIQTGSDWRERFPRLAKLFQRLGERESFKGLKSPDS